jgi:hypothetical protein
VRGAPHWTPTHSSPFFLQLTVMQGAAQEQLVYASELKEKYSVVEVVRTKTRRGVVISNAVHVKPPVITATKEDAAAFQEDLAFGESATGVVHRMQCALLSTCAAVMRARRAAGNSSTAAAGHFRIFPKASRLPGTHDPVTHTSSLCCPTHSLPSLSLCSGSCFVPFTSIAGGHGWQALLHQAAAVVADAVTSSRQRGG